MKFEAVIGLEIHTQLNTKSKLFSTAATSFGATQNENASMVDLAMPGTLPVINKEAINKALLFGLAIEAEIGSKNVFERKNYFYPDLPKGYQTSQLEFPIVGKGKIDINVEGETKTIGITRAHLEEDAGKSIHDLFIGETAIDLNRAGTPLLEIVSEPELSNAAEAVAYAKAIHSLVRYLGISDGNMAEGSFRVDCNISVREKGTTKLNTRTELKNINSFRFIEKAIEGEIERQIDVYLDGGKVVQETRLYDSTKNITRSMRSKEEANDYRYFPCPDLLPVQITDEMMQNAQNNLPELPNQKATRFLEEYQLTAYDCALLANDKDLSDYFEAIVKITKDAKLSANWLLQDLTAYLNKQEKSFSENDISVANFAKLIQRIQDNTISGKIAKTLIEELATNDVDDLIEKKGLKQVNDETAILKMVQEIIDNNPQQVSDYRTLEDEAKKGKMFNFLVGQLMKVSKGKVNPKQANEMLKKLLD